MHSVKTAAPCTARRREVLRVYISLEALGICMGQVLALAGETQMNLLCTLAAATGLHARGPFESGLGPSPLQPPSGRIAQNSQKKPKSLERDYCLLGFFEKFRFLLLFSF